MEWNASRKHLRRKEYVVYSDRPPWPRGGCRVVAKRIEGPWEQFRDFLPASIGTIKFVIAESAAEAKRKAGVRCGDVSEVGWSRGARGRSLSR